MAQTFNVRGGQFSASVVVKTSDGAGNSSSIAVYTVSGSDALSDCHKVARALNATMEKARRD